MTVEMQRTITNTERIGFLGLRTREVKEVKKRVLEYRNAEQSDLGGSVIVTLAKPEIIGLSFSRDEDGVIELYGTHRFGFVVSADEVKIHDMSINRSGLATISNQQALIGEQINDAHLVTGDGAMVSWRETKPGDYPEIKPIASYSGALVMEQT